MGIMFFPTVFIVALVGLGSSVQLTLDTWNDEVEGKTVFVKFAVPWCGHCESMRPAWDKLMGAHEDSTNVLVAEVDCDGAGRSLCQKHGVQGYPTLMHGAPQNLEVYDGGRDWDALNDFV